MSIFSILHRHPIEIRPRRGAEIDECIYSLHDNRRYPRNIEIRRVGTVYVVFFEGGMYVCPVQNHIFAGNVYDQVLNDGIQSRFKAE